MRLKVYICVRDIEIKICKKDKELSVASAMKSSFRDRLLFRARMRFINKEFRYARKEH